MKRILLFMLLLLAPAMAKEAAQLPAPHVRAIQALGLPLYLLPDNSDLAYRSAILTLGDHSKGYELQYWIYGEPAIRLRFAMATRVTEKARPVKALETRKERAGGFGTVAVTRFKGGCHTEWTRCPGGFFRMETNEELPLDRFIQILEAFHARPAVAAHATVHQEALAVTGLPDIQLNNLKPTLETFMLDAIRPWHNHILEYHPPGVQSTFELVASRGGIGDVGVGFRHPPFAEKVLRVATLGKVYAVESAITYGPTKGNRQCYTEWTQVGQGYFHVRCEHIAFARFLELVGQLRAR